MSSHLFRYVASHVLQSLSSRYDNSNAYIGDLSPGTNASMLGSVWRQGKGYAVISAFWKRAAQSPGLPVNLTSRPEMIMIIILLVSASISISVCQERAVAASCCICFVSLAWHLCVPVYLDIHSPFCVGQSRLNGLCCEQEKMVTCSNVCAGDLLQSLPSLQRDVENRLKDFTQRLNQAASGDFKKEAKPGA